MPLSLSVGRGKLRRFGALTLAVVVLIGVIGALGAPRAWAHDVLVEASPADGAVLHDPPQEVALTFSGELLELNPVIIVSNSSGQVVTQEPPLLQGYTASLPLPPLDDGDYRVQWSVVSSDGHRIEGDQEFSLEAGPGQTPTTEGQEDQAAAPGSEPAAAETTPSTEQETTTEQEPASQPDGADQAGQEASGLGALPIWIAIILAVALIAAVVVAASKRRRQ